MQCCGHSHLQKQNNNPLTCTICCPLVSLTTSSVRAEQTAEHKRTRLRGLRQIIISIQRKHHKLHKGKFIEPRKHYKSRYVTAYQGSIDTFYDVQLVYSFLTQISTHQFSTALFLLQGQLLSAEKIQINHHISRLFTVPSIVVRVEQ